MGVDAKPALYQLGQADQRHHPHKRALSQNPQICIAAQAESPWLAGGADDDRDAVMNGAEARASRSAGGAGIGRPVKNAGGRCHSFSMTGLALLDEGHVVQHGAAQRVSGGGVGEGNLRRWPGRGDGHLLIDVSH